MIISAYQLFIVDINTCTCHLEKFKSVVIVYTLSVHIIYSIHVGLIDPLVLI